MLHMAEAQIPDLSRNDCVLVLSAYEGIGEIWVIGARTYNVIDGGPFEVDGGAALGLGD